MIYKGFSSKIGIFSFFGFAINKVVREFFILKFSIWRRKNISRIYAAHGSFVIISKHAIKTLNNSLYDEKMFLFDEERVLAKKAYRANLITIYDGSFFVVHKEDGSMKLSNFSINGERLKSGIYYYENYVLHSDI